MKHRVRVMMMTAAVSLFALACGDDFLPSSSLAGLRTLAVLADPLELAPGERAVLEPLVHSPRGASVSHEWTFCPISLGPRAAFACVLPACETSLPSDARGRVEADTTALLSSCIETLRSSGGAPPGAPSSAGELPERIELTFRHTARSAGEERRTVQRLAQYIRAAPAERNRPPKIAAIRLAGTPVEIGPTRTATIVLPNADLVNLAVEVEIDPSSMGPGEEPITSFFSTQGRFDKDRDDGLSASATIEAEDGAPPLRSLTIYVVVRDGSGGQTAAGPIEVRAAASEGTP